MNPTQWSLVAAAADGDTTLAQACSHPLRARVLEMLVNEDLSPNDATMRLSDTGHDATLGTVAYHFRKLAEFGLIELTATHQRRGAIQHVYRLTIPPRA